MSFFNILFVSSFLFTFGNYCSDARRSREKLEYNQHIFDQNIDTELNGDFEDIVHVQYSSKTNRIQNKGSK